MKLIIETLHAAAFYLTKYPESTAEEVAAFVSTEKRSVSKRTIERWSTTAEWHTALDNLGFTGDRGWRRNPHRDIERDSGDEVALAKQLYLEARAKGITRGKADKAVAKVLGCSDKRIYHWRKRWGWESEVSHETEK